MIFLGRVCHNMQRKQVCQHTKASVTIQASQRQVAKCIAPPPPAQLALLCGNSKHDCTVLKIEPFRNRWAYITVFGLILTLLRQLFHAF